MKAEDWMKSHFSSPQPCPLCQGVGVDPVKNVRTGEEASCRMCRGTGSLSRVREGISTEGTRTDVVVLGHKLRPTGTLAVFEQELSVWCGRYRSVIEDDSRYPTTADKVAGVLAMMEDRARELVSSWFKA